MSVLYFAFTNYIFVVGFIASSVTFFTCIRSDEKKGWAISGFVIAVVSVLALIFQLLLTRVPNIDSMPLCSAIVLLNEADLEYVVNDENGEIVNAKADSLVRLAEPSLAKQCITKGTTITLLISSPEHDKTSITIEETSTPSSCAIPDESGYREFIINDIEPGSDSVYFSTFTFEELSDAQINDLNFTMKIHAGSYSPSDLLEMENIKDELYYEVEDHWFNFLAPQLNTGSYTLLITANDGDTYWFSYKEFEVK